jgi:hypothetical protein
LPPIRHSLVLKVALAWCNAVVGNTEEGAPLRTRLASRVTL